MIKKIQIRGISRTPSDQLNVDGGCDESLNVQLLDTEVAPMLAPTNLSQEEHLPDGDYIYIHKFEGHENYVFLDDGKICATNGNDVDEIVDLETNETVVSVTSVGKTLIVYGSVNTYYIVWKDTGYLFLGNRIPEPVVRYDVSARTDAVTVSAFSKSDFFGIVSGQATDDLTARFILGTYTPDAYDAVYGAFVSGALTKELIDGSTTIRLDSGFEKIPDICSNYVWGIVNQMYRRNKEDKYFSAPVLIRYAVKLYDGTNIYQSVPFLVGNTLNQFLNLTRTKDPNDSQISNIRFELMKMLATATVTWDIGNWEDIVDSVEFAISTDICNPKWNDIIKSIIPTTSDTGQACNARFLFSKQSEWNAFEDVREEILSKVNFYKIHEMTTEEFESEGGEIIWTVEPKMQDELVVRETMKDSGTPHEYGAVSGATSYNMRSILYGIKTKLTSGYPFLQSTVATTRLGDNFYWWMKYYVRSASGDTYTVLARDSEGDTDIYNDGGSGETYPVPLGLLVYPDPKCYKVEVYDSRTDKMYSIPMKEHPGLHCAYALCDLASPVTSLGTEIDAIVLEENNTFVSENTIMMSEAYNPFLYDLLNQKSFGGKVLGVAPTTMALSTDTFGRYPLYVFSSEGVDAVSVNDDGSFGSVGHVSRDVAIRGTIKAIDKAVVFSTDRGVMLLTEKGIDCISPYMNGRHIKLEDAVVELLADTEWADFVPEGDESFMAFIKQARPAYDYPGSRLIFFNPDKAYQYVYSILSRSWHKMLPSKDFVFGTVLNSYPECLVTGLTEGSSHVMDFSTHLDASLEDDEDPENDQAVLPGIIKTRTISLDADNLYKGIRSIRIRGDFKAGSVKYILLASHDGKEFRVLHSLRGPSWKYYKLVVLSRMRPNDRIAYVEFDLNERFTDKIR